MINTSDAITPEEQWSRLGDLPAELKLLILSHCLEAPPSAFSEPYLEDAATIRRETGNVLVLSKTVHQTLAPRYHQNVCFSFNGSSQFERTFLSTATSTCTDNIRSVRLDMSHEWAFVMESDIAPLTVELLQTMDLSRRLPHLDKLEVITSSSYSDDCLVWCKETAHGSSPWIDADSDDAQQWVDYLWSPFPMPLNDTVKALATRFDSWDASWMVDKNFDCRGQRRKTRLVTGSRSPVRPDKVYFEKTTIVLQKK